MNMNRWVLVVLFLVGLVVAGLVDDGTGASGDSEAAEVCHYVGPFDQYEVGCENLSWAGREVRISNLGP